MFECKNVKVNVNPNFKTSLAILYTYTVYIREGLYMFSRRFIPGLPCSSCSTVAGRH